MIYPVEALAGSLSPNTKRPHIRLIDPIRMTKRCHSLFSNREYVFLICRAIVATKAIKLLQIHASPAITCPAQSIGNARRYALATGKPKSMRLWI